jgi:predicted dehydrogenase
MTRRTLLAALAVPRPIGIGFLGTSHSHGEAKLETILANPQYRLIGVTEPATRANSAPVLSQSELLAHTEIDVIAVESQVRDHARHAIAVLEAGKHLHLEKAPSDNMKDFARIVALAQRRNRLLQLGYMWRYHPGLTLALDAVKQGWLGQVYMVRAEIGNTLAAQRRPEWAEFKGGNMFELGCHLIDPIVRMLGRPQKVTPYLHKHGRFDDTLNDNNAAVLEYPGAMAIIYGSNLQHNAAKHRAFEVQGANGSILINPIEPPTVTIELAKAAGPFRAGVQQAPMPPYKRYADDFVELAGAIRGTSRLLVSPEEELLVHEVLLRASDMF